MPGSSFSEYSVSPNLNISVALWRTLWVAPPLWHRVRSWHRRQANQLDFLRNNTIFAPLAQIIELFSAEEGLFWLPCADYRLKKETFERIDYCDWNVISLIINGLCIPAGRIGRAGIWNVLIIMLLLITVEVCGGHIFFESRWISSILYETIPKGAVISENILTLATF